MATRVYFTIGIHLNTRQSMFEIILFSPQIPPNTGNVIRLSANCGTRLHLVRPLGFDLDEKACRRAGLDYHTLGDVSVHDDLDTCLADIGAPRVFVITTKPSEIMPIPVSGS